MDLNDDLLGLVLERVGSHVSLIRAAAVCRRWRRAITDGAFLRRYRSLHAPAVVGDYHNRSWRPGNVTVFVPSSPPVVDARHFSLDFLPGGAEAWTISDSRGSLLLMRCRSGARTYLVCEPLTRRYRRIPLPPDLDFHHQLAGSYLVGGRTKVAGGAVSMYNFRVLCKLYRGRGTHATVFRASPDSKADSTWSEKGINNAILMYTTAYPLGRAGGSWYFHGHGSKLITLDSSTGELSSSGLPMVEDLGSRIQSFNIQVADGCDGEPRIFLVLEGSMKVFMRNNGEWALEKEVILSEVACGLPGYNPSYFIEDQGIIMRGTGFITIAPQSGVQVPWLFSIDLTTMEAAPAVEDMGGMMHRCELPWPPALHACLDR